MKLVTPQVPWHQFRALLLSDATVAEVIAEVAAATGRTVTPSPVYAARNRARAELPALGQHPMQ